MSKPKPPSKAEIEKAIDIINRAGGVFIADCHEYHCGQSLYYGQIVLDEDKNMSEYFGEEYLEENQVLINRVLVSI